MGSSEEIKRQAVENVTAIVKREKEYLSLLEQEKEVLEAIIKNFKSTLVELYNLEMDYDRIKREQQLFYVNMNIVAKNKLIEKQQQIIDSNK